MSYEFTTISLECEPRLAECDFEFSEIMDDKDDFAFISGSVIEGFGNKASDVDIYVVSKKEIGFTDGKKNNYTNSEKGYYNEVNWFSYQWHKAVADKINALPLESLWSVRIDSSELNYYYRTTVGVPLINNDVFDQEVKAYRKDWILKVLEYYWGYQAYKSFKYAQELVSVDEIEQSYFWINDAIGKMLDSVLANNGEGYVSSKFRFAKLERAFGKTSEIYLKAKQLRYLGNYRIHDYIAESIELIRNLGVETFAFDNVEIKYRIAGNIERISLFHTYVAHNYCDIFQVDEQCLHIINLIENGHRSRKDIKKYCTEMGGKVVDDIISSLHLLGIIEIEQ